MPVWTTTIRSCMKSLLFALCLFSATLFGETPERIKFLIQRVRPDHQVWTNIDETLQRADTLPEHARQQVFDHVHRMLRYAVDLPLLKEGLFLEKQSHLILMASKVLEQEREIPLSDYATSSKHPQVHFIYDIETGDRIAVFKSDGLRHYEQLTWYAAAIFGLEDVFTPAMTLTVGGIAGELQAFQTTDLTTEQSYNTSLYDLITFESYMKSALGVLLFALYDMHNENCFYQFRREGYIQLGFWDTMMAFDRDRFLPHTSSWGTPSLDTPFSWIGWDFPQRKRAISKRFKAKLLDVVSSWPKRIQLFREYVHHPLTEASLSDELTEKVIQRAQTLHHVILQRPERPIKEWHEALCPDYPRAEQKLKEFFPDYKTMWILFRLRWIPDEALNWIEGDQQEEYKAWLNNFLD